jgi:hypothetical protein
MKFGTALYDFLFTAKTLEGIGFVTNVIVTGTGEQEALERAYQGLEEKAATHNLTVCESTVDASRILPAGATGTDLGLSMWKL